MEYQQTFSFTQIISMTNTLKTPFAEIWGKYKNNFYPKQKKYRRLKAADLIGFTKEKGAFTRFLRSNYIICTENIPNPYLIEKNFMSFSNKIEPKKSNKNINTPLFTEKGIDYLKKMVNDPNFLSSEYIILKANLAHSSYQNFR